MQKDELGQRMKENYEDRTRLKLPRRTYTIIRLDGKAFHTFTRHFKRPFDYTLMGLMDQTTMALCKEIQGVKFAFTQSDEISLLLTDFDTEKTNAWFDGNVQKMTSVSASIATAAFNQVWTSTGQYINGAGAKLAHFDSRVFTIPDKNEVMNYFIWRQQDATRNSIQMAAQALYSQKELQGRNTSELQELMWQKGINWNDYPSSSKRGRAIIKESYVADPVTPTRPLQTVPLGPVWRTHWVALTGIGESPETPVFTQDTMFLKGLVPTLT